MDTLHTLLGQGTLDYLTLLERRAQRLKNIQKDFDERHVAVEDLQSRITELRARRDQLRKGLKEKAQSETENASSNTVAEVPVSEEMAALLAMRQQLEDLKSAYRITGKSINVVDRHTLRLCFDTCHKGRYLAPHYVELKLGEEGASITRHTLPVYIPVDILKEKLKVSIKVLMETVHGYLQAEAIRQQETRSVQEEFGDRLVGEIFTTPSYDFIQLILDSVPYCRGAPVAVQLKYDDLTRWRPTRVKVAVQDEAVRAAPDQTREREVAKITELFKERDIFDTITFLLPDDPEMEEDHN